MNFLDKINNDNNHSDELNFLKDYGFEWDSCAYGKGYGWMNGYYSANGLEFNRIRVWIENDVINLDVHNEYECGGLLWSNCDSIPSYSSIDDILKAINDLLPDDID